MVGYMPLKSSYGFLTPNATPRDAAHELGHGVFNFRHTFSNDNIVTLPEGETQNLMDYSGGKELFKYQWDYAHDTESGLFVFEDSEEGAMMGTLILTAMQRIKEAHAKGQTEITTSFITRTMGDWSEHLSVENYSFSDIQFRMGSSEPSQFLQPFNGEKYKIHPKGYIKTEWTNEVNGIEYVKYEFKNLIEVQGLPPYGSTMEPQGETVLWFDVKKEEEFLFEDYLYPSENIQINIDVILIEENELNTFSSFLIDNGKVRGYIIEREPGTYEEERTSNSKKRIPGNEYGVVKNDCQIYYIDLGKTPRKNCINEYRLLTTYQKSGTRSGILIHRGINYNSSTGCLITVGDGYSIDEIDLDVAGEIKLINVYNSNGTSNNTLNNINAYVNRKMRITECRDVNFSIIININR